MALLGARVAKGVVAAAGAVLFVGLLVLVPGDGGSGPAPPAVVEPTISAAEARLVVAEFVDRMNRADVAGAFALLDDAARTRPEAIDGLAANPLIDVRQEYAYAVWTAALQGERRLESCAVEQWEHLVDGVRVVDDAQLVTCSGTFTSAFYAAMGLAPMPMELIVAVGGRREVLLFQEYIVSGADTAALLRYRRWLRTHHPEDEAVVFTPGGSPTATLASAALMLTHAPWLAVDPAG